MSEKDSNEISDSFYSDMEEKKNTKQVQVVK